MSSSKKGDVQFAVFPYNFFIYEVYGNKFCMSKSYHTVHQVEEDFFQKRSYFPEKR